MNRPREPYVQVHPAHGLLEGYRQNKPLQYLRKARGGFFTLDYLPDADVLSLFRDHRSDFRYVDPLTLRKPQGRLGRVSFIVVRDPLRGTEFLNDLVFLLLGHIFHAKNKSPGSRKGPDHTVANTRLGKFPADDFFHVF